MVSLYYFLDKTNIADYKHTCHHCQKSLIINNRKNLNGMNKTEHIFLFLLIM